MAAPDYSIKLPPSLLPIGGGIRVPPGEPGNPGAMVPGGPVPTPSSFEVPYTPPVQPGVNVGPYNVPAGSTAPSGGGSMPTPPSTNPGNDAANLAYARAKDMIGQQTRGALMALRDQGTSGGQYVAGGVNPALEAATGQVISHGNTNLANFVSRQASQQANAAYEADKLRYQGELSNYMAQQARNGQLNQSLLGLLGPDILSGDKNINSNTDRILSLLKRLGVSGGSLY